MNIHFVILQFIFFQQGVTVFRRSKLLKFRLRRRCTLCGNFILDFVACGIGAVVVLPKLLEIVINMGSIILSKGKVTPMQFPTVKILKEFL